MTIMSLFLCKLAFYLGEKIRYRINLTYTEELLVKIGYVGLKIEIQKYVYRRLRTPEATEITILCICI